MIRRKSKIVKILLIGLWSVIGGGMLVLLIPAIREKKQKICQGSEISIRGINQQIFLDEKKIGQLLVAGGNSLLKGKEIRSFDLSKMEKELEKSIWISDAELFFDNKQILQVKVRQRQPIARIFTVTGKSYYIDSSGVKLPLSPEVFARLPVFTNFPGERDKFNQADHALLKNILNISSYLHKNPFWMAQISQVGY